LRTGADRTGPGWAVWLLRILRGGRRSFGLTALSLALATGALATLLLLENSLRAGLQREAVALVGGEVVVEANWPFDRTALETLLPEGSRIARLLHTHSFLEVDGRRVPVSIKAVDEAYPLFGSLRLDPDGSPQEALAGRGAVADAQLFARIGEEPGARARLGRVELELRARLVAEPDRPSGPLQLGARLLLSIESLEEAGVMRPGALVHESLYIDLPPQSRPEEVAARIRSELAGQGVEVETPGEMLPQITGVLEDLFTYLAFAGLALAFLAGLAVAIAARAQLRARRLEIAVLKALGAGRGQLVALLAGEVTLAAVLGALAGLLVGGAVAALVLARLEPLLPFETALTAPVATLLVVVLLAPATALAFTLPTLFRLADVPAGLVFRAVVRPLPSRITPLRAAVVTASGGVLLALAALALPQPRLLPPFLLALSALLALSWGSARVLGMLAERLRRRAGASTLVAVLAAVARPASPLPALMLGLGLGTALLTSLLLLHGSLRAELALRVPARTADVFLLDVRPEERARARELVAAFGGAVVEEAPVVRGRVVALDGVEAWRAEVDPRFRWVVQGDRALSWRADPPSDGRIVAGRWWSQHGAERLLVSVEERVAKGLGLELGSKVRFNILGRLVEAEVANIREAIDWRRGQLGFAFLFSPGVLEQAPHSYLFAARVPEAAEGPLLEALLAELSGLTPVSVRAILARLREVLDAAIRILMLVALAVVLGGVAVLAAAVFALFEAQRYTFAILKAIGATRLQLFTRVAGEYGAIGILAAVFGTVLGLAAALALLQGLLEVPLATTPWMLLPAAAVVAVTLAVGAGVCRRLYRTSTAQLLRAPM